MTQPSLLTDIDQRDRKRINVPRTSVEAGRAVNRDARMNRVLDALSDWVDEPTSAELASWFFQHYVERPTTDQVLYVRRGLSDLLAAGYVEHGPARKCAVSGKKCLTWRVRSR